MGLHGFKRDSIPMCNLWVRMVIGKSPKVLGNSNTRPAVTSPVPSATDLQKKEKSHRKESVAVVFPPYPHNLEHFIIVVYNVATVKTLGDLLSAKLKLNTRKPAVRASRSSVAARLSGFLSDLTTSSVSCRGLPAFIPCSLPLGGRITSNAHSSSPSHVGATI